MAPLAPQLTFSGQNYDKKRILGGKPQLTQKMSRELQELCVPHLDYYLMKKIKGIQFHELHTAAHEVTARGLELRRLQVQVTARGLELRRLQGRTQLTGLRSRWARQE